MTLILSELYLYRCCCSHNISFVSLHLNVSIPSFRLKYVFIHCLIFSWCGLSKVFVLVQADNDMCCYGYGNNETIVMYKLLVSVSELPDDCIAPLVSTLGYEKLTVMHLLPPFPLSYFMHSYMQLLCRK